MLIIILSRKNDYEQATLLLANNTSTNEHGENMNENCSCGYHNKKNLLKNVGYNYNKHMGKN